MPPSAAALADLFAKARLTLNIFSSSSSYRSVVFFDEVLNVEAVLTLPSDRLIPIPVNSIHDVPTSYPLPLPAPPSRPQFGHSSIPPHLIALLACLHVNLCTDYVPQHSSTSIHSSKSTNPYEPLATVELPFEHLQLLPSHHPHTDPAQPHHVAIRAFSNAWAGNQPPKPHRTLNDFTHPQSSTTAAPSSHRAHLVHDAHHWRVHWHCRVPINFIATPFQPLFSITAALTLRLDNVLLDQLLPRPSSQVFVRSGFAHSLLAPLHEGPIYPDESPLQSQARADASSALGLDGPNGLGSYLAHLPKDVVGGNNTVVTPRSGAQALNAIQQRRNDALTAQAAPSRSLSKPDSNGDLAALLSNRSASSSQLPSTSASQTDNRESEQHAVGLQIYKRSTRAVLPLRTGINVRMRTLVTHHHPWTHRRPSLHQPTPELESTRLVLSVELENPFESDSTFCVNDIQIKIDRGSTEQQNAFHVIAQPLQPIPSVLPILLKKGSQHNLLFYVSVGSNQFPHSIANSTDAEESSARNVIITVSGRPQRDRSEQEEELSADFDSQWNCALDLTPVLADAKKEKFIASGARTSVMERKVVARPVAGNSQYSASSLRAAQWDENMHGTQAQQATDYGGDLRTPRPGQLGMGFPPPLRTSSARHVSTAVSTADQTPNLSRDDLGRAGGFLENAKARASNRLSNSNSYAAGEAAAWRVKPWISSSVSTRDFAQEEGGLVVLSTLRRAGSRRIAGNRALKFESSLGQDGQARRSVSTGAKILHPVSVSATSAEERGFRVQTGDTIVVDLALLNKSAFPKGESDAIGGVHLSWIKPPSSNTVLERSSASRDSIDAGTGTIKVRLMDADSARLKSHLTSSQAESINGLIPVEDHLLLHSALFPGQSKKLSLGLRCISPGYHDLPPLRMRFGAVTGVEELILDGLGAVLVTPAAVI
ncbi:uncharacterized protein MEPE_03224 [Melanopsichium pennsylvanicum]|uniref:TRAPP trafficking subunit Trs65-domain-containing protein n=2 Tax=Melanopsichium pennsylvanicum TaxID=63383 RepID=A0AAJ4XL14_9BASI|nr:putative protein [Melanopsichium pennsylvanicum 4]SNX84515.1 uncharacterized protein MEPE_03224 [Melanopsichium pennsylvanicum]